jgi:ABC-type branched-subunit amino acid transport system ATPase component
VTAAAPSAVEVEVTSLPLVVEGVGVSFGGLRALAGVDLVVDEGEVVGLIGGNGAGKTTLMDCISGYVRPDDGSIRAMGVELTGLAPADRPYIGVGRSYQDARLFPGLTVQETLLVMHERHHPTGLLAAVLGLASGRRAEQTKREQVERLIVTMGLGPYRDKLVGELSTGTRRVVDLASILAQQPRLLLLDEPTAGLAQRETEAFGPLLRRVRDQLDCAVLLIEHDMVLIAEVSDRVYALESGRVIAQGEPSSVLAHPAVVAGYLGTDEDAIRRSGSRQTTDEPGSGPKAAELTRAELLELAAGAGIPGRHRMRKAELVERLVGQAPR